jgi:hypothetical protein
MNQSSSALRSTKVGQGLGGGAEVQRKAFDVDGELKWNHFRSGVRRGEGGRGVLDEVRGDGGGIVNMRRLLMKTVDAGLGIIETEEDQLFEAAKTRRGAKNQRPPKGKPAGYEHLSTAFCVTDA